MSVKSSMEQRGFVFAHENLLSPQRALERYFARVAIAPPRVERVALEDARERILAIDVAADADYPAHARSAMDGFAVRRADLPGTLDVVGEIAMGSAWSGTLESGCALRIPTGGAIPEGADAVVPIEDAAFDGRRVRVVDPVDAGSHITPVGSDMERGTPIAHAGTRIRAPLVGVLATLGCDRVAVFVRPRIAVLSSGDELVAVDATPAAGQVRDSNRYAIAATLQAMGAGAMLAPVVPDDPGALARALRAALDDADAVVLSGGSSVGERDATVDAIRALEPDGVVVHGLAVKPGKPTVLAHVGGKPVIGLPGNPTSAMLVAHAAIAPIVAVLTGERRRAMPITATLCADVVSRKGWTWYVPVSVRHEAGALVAQPHLLRSSSVSLTARADGYIEVPGDVERLSSGATVAVHAFA